MQRTRIKICGVTRVEDALAAAEAGADAIGMVFYRAAPRCISMDRAQEILRAIPPFVTPVGLFVDAELSELRETIELLGLRHIQLHGHESPETVAALKNHVVLKAVRVSRLTVAAELAEWRQAIETLSLDHLKGFVLETAGTGIGGTGQQNDWETIARLRLDGAFDGLPPLIAAGGLNPENVARIVGDIRPWAVDVSSGVEAVKGQKSVQKIEAFVQAVREADRERGRS